MHHWAKCIIVAAAPLFLTGCLWGPGKFASDLALKKDGSFTLDYRGEIVLQLPPEGNDRAEPWRDDMAVCFDKSADKPVTGVTVDPADRKTRPCTKSEIASQKADYEKGEATLIRNKRNEMEQTARLFGLPGVDDASAREFAAKLMKYEGWRSVTYRGKGVFDVDYHFSGRATQDFLFPALPDNDLIIPFIAIRRRTDGSVMVTAPALTGGMGPLGSRAGNAAAAAAKDGPMSRAEGRFTIVTDGETLTNNSEDGPTVHPAGRQLAWTIGTRSKKIPETLIRLR